MSRTNAKLDRLLSRGRVAEMFGVDPKTVTRWAKAGRLRATRTPGVTGLGHRRYRESDVRALLDACADEPAAPAEVATVETSDPSARVL